VDCTGHTRSGMLSVVYSKQGSNTKHYDDITVNLLLLQSVTYSCYDLEGPCSSFMDYFREEQISSRKVFLFKTDL
jgi:hypothetical protein